MSDQGGLGQLKEAIEAMSSIVHISVENMALIKQGFYQVANGTSDDRKTVGRGASVPISAKHLGSRKPIVRWGANKPLILMWWRTIE